jgi:hypothetical protein
MDATSELTKELLDDNFQRLKEKVDRTNEVAEIEGFVHLLPSSHTFPFYKSWGGPSPGETYPYKEILFSQRALLSNKRRVTLGFIKTGEPQRKMEKARSINLDAFVFCSMGAHDAYYSGSLDSPNPPFGVFVKPRTEAFPHCHATHHDLASPEANPNEIQEFLHSVDSRTLSYITSKRETRHLGDYWHYWGSPEYFLAADYASDLWKWKSEFHFLEKIQIQEFDAVLWPFEETRTRLGFREISPVGGDKELRAFRKTNPNCSVVSYRFEADHFSECLLRASYETAIYFTTHHEYPSSVGDVKI